MCSAEDRIMGNGKILCGFHTNDITGTGGLIRITRIKGIVENKTIISLAVAESILRRNPYGVGIERVQVK